MAERGTATATIVFTDVVGSTELRTQLGEVASDELFRTHERRLSDAVAAHRGRVVKAAGDGIMASFDAASDAVAAAVAMQQEAVRSAPPLSIRVGAAAGDVSWAGGDCSGLPVVTAARLQDHAAGGQILVSQVVRWLAGDRAGDPYLEVGPVSLKGLEAPVTAFEVAWEPAAAAQTGNGFEQPALPASLQAAGTFHFVGRAEEWDVLGAAWSEVVRGGRRVVLLGGEAGAGKTRLAAEFSRHCHTGGATVLFGGCDDQLSIPYQPWVQALDHIVRLAPDELLTVDPHGDVAELALLLPQLERMLPPRPRSSDSDPEADRYRLFAAVVSFLGRIGAEQPVVVVLDDLHWAGAQTLALLRYLVRSGGGEHLLVIGTFRDTGDEITEPLAQCLVDLRRSDDVLRVRVEGLDVRSVESFVEVTTGQPLDDDLRRIAAALAQRSAGNAFYLGELWRHLVTCGAITCVDDRWVVTPGADTSGVPESVKEVVSARLARLSPAARAVGELASVAGHRTEERVLRHAAALSDEALGAALDELVEAGLLAESGGHHLGYAFPHALVRDTVEETVALRARSRLHLSVADAFEQAYGADRRPILADLARHFAAGAAFGGGPKAVYYGRRAALQAMRAAAYEEAASYLETAIVLAVEGSSEWVDLMLDLGFSQLRSGTFAACQETYRRAFAAAHELGLEEATARAAIGLEQSLHMPGLSGVEAVVAVTEAKAMVGDEPSPLGAQLHASLARAYAHTGRLDEALVAVEEARALGRASGDVESQSTALEAALIAMLDDPARVLELTEELEAVSVGSRDPWHLLYSTSHRLRVLVELGRLDEATDLLARHRIHSDQYRYAAFQIVGLGFDVVLALAAGRFDDAERAAERARDIRLEDDAAFGSGVYGLQMFAIRREQGRLGEVAPVLRVVAARGDSGAASVWRPGLAALHADLGMVEEARSGFAELAADGFASIARDALWPASISFLAEACVAVGAREHAELVYEEIVPRRGRNLMVGMTVCLGPADRHLGNLAALLGRHAAADEHFETALGLARRSDSPVWEAQACRDQARFLRARGKRDRAAAQQARAHEIAVAIGMLAVAAQTEPDAASPGSPEPAAPVAPDGLSGRELEVLRLVAAGSSNREIGDVLHISQNTVANHVRAILQKTGCANRTEAAAYAARRQLLDA